MQKSDKFLSGLDLLLVEDEFLIAVDAEEILTSFDAARIRIVSTYEEAERFAREEMFDAAVLDVNINGKMSFAIGEILKQRGIPFVFASGYALSDRPIEGFKGGICVRKPYNSDQLRRGLMEALASSTATTG